MTDQTRPTFLWVIRNEKFPKQERNDVLPVLKNLAIQHGVKKILFDLSRVESSITTMERVQYGKQAASMLGSLQMGVLIHVSLLDKDKLIETVAVNRGANFAVFLELNLALDWLDVQEDQAVMVTLE